MGVNSRVSDLAITHLNYAIPFLRALVAPMGIVDSPRLQLCHAFSFLLFLLGPWESTTPVFLLQSCRHSVPCYFYSSIFVGPLGVVDSRISYLHLHQCLTSPVTLLHKNDMCNTQRGNVCMVPSYMVSQSHRNFYSSRGVDDSSIAFQASQSYIYFYSSRLTTPAFLVSQLHVYFYSSRGVDDSRTYGLSITSLFLLFKGSR